MADAQKRREVTIHDIAAYMNLAPSTISRALHNSKKISKETREKVRYTARILGYQAQFAHANLNGQPAQTIGVVVPDLQDTFFAAAIAGMQELAAKQGFHILLSQSGYSAQKEEDALNMLLQAGINGLIVSLDPSGRNHAQIFQEFFRQNIPVAQFYHANYDVAGIKVVADNFHAGYQATQHLLSTGNRRIAVISGSGTCQLCKELLDGYREALKEHGISYSDRYVKHTDADASQVQKALQELLDSGEPPHALIAPNPIIAMQAVNQLHMRKISIPDTIALVSIGDAVFNRLFTPSITAMDMNAYQTGESTANALIQHLQDKGPENKTIISPTRLIIRKSSMG